MSSDDVSYLIDQRVKEIEERQVEHDFVIESNMNTQISEMIKECSTLKNELKITDENAKS